MNNEKTEALESLNRTAIEQLQGRFGEDAKISATSASLKALLATIDRERAAALLIADDDGYCRQSFDRTSPGYDKLYDKCSSILIDPGVLVENQEVLEN